MTNDIEELRLAAARSLGWRRTFALPSPHEYWERYDIVGVGPVVGPWVAEWRPDDPSRETAWQRELLRCHHRMAVVHYPDHVWLSTVDASPVGDIVITCRLADHENDRYQADAMAITQAAAEVYWRKQHD